MGEMTKYVYMEMLARYSVGTIDQLIQYLCGLEMFIEPEEAQLLAFLRRYRNENQT